MPRYLITQSLLAAWAYTFDCREDAQESAMEEFLRTLRREKGEPTEAMLQGRAFEDAVYANAAGICYEIYAPWGKGIRAAGAILRDAQVQVRLSRPLETEGMEFLVYGILDGLKAGVIYDVKFCSRKFSNAESDPGIYGKYLNSPQHPIYFYLVPEAYDFRYLVSDGEDLYIETYHRGQTRRADEVIGEFIRSIREMGLFDLYKENWEAKDRTC